MFMVPAMIEAIVKLVPNVRDYDFSSLEIIAYGASPISASPGGGDVSLRLPLQPGLWHDRNLRHSSGPGPRTMRAVAEDPSADLLWQTLPR